MYYETRVSYLGRVTKTGFKVSLQNIMELNFNSVLKLCLDYKSEGFIFLTGAGASVESGFPIYRNKTKSLFTRENLYSNPSSVLKDLSKIHEIRKSLKNYPTTLLFANKLNLYGMLRGIYTQNIDILETGLRTKNGTKRAIELSDSTVFLHGKMNLVVCDKCGFKRRIDDYDLEQYRVGKFGICTECRPFSKRKRPLAPGQLRPDVLMLNETTFDIPGCI